MSDPSLRIIHGVVLDALRTIGGKTPCRGRSVLFTDIKDVTDQDAADLCAGCPLLNWKTEDGSIRNICLMLGRAEGAAAAGSIYGGKVMRR